MIVENKYIINEKQVNSAGEFRTQELFEILTEMGGIHSEMIGNGSDVLMAKKLSWVLLTWKIKFIKRPKLNDEILVKTWVRKSDGITSVRDFEVYNSEDEKIIIASSKWCLINLETRRPVRFDDDLSNAYAPEDKNAFGEELPRVKEPQEYELEKEYVIQKEDIDVNGHVHNSNYLDVAFDIIPGFDESKKNYDNVLIEFKKEIMYEDNVRVHYKNEKDKDIVALKVDGKLNALLFLS
ncbi:MAG: hypothetical protein IKJ32_07150 [Clostridia bacterium]|nr:hypothetical protein [Clostridia bacterium]